MIGTMISESWVPYFVLPSEEATALYLETHLGEPLADWVDLDAILFPVVVQDCLLLIVAVVQEATAYVLNPNNYGTIGPANSRLEWFCGIGTIAHMVEVVRGHGLPGQDDYTASHFPVMRAHLVACILQQSLTPLEWKII